MARIFSVLAVLALVMLAANFLIGLSIGDFGAAAQRLVTAKRESDRREMEKSPDDSATKARQQFAAAAEEFARPRKMLTLHFYLGVASSLLAILVCSITVTYFIGTSRWCKEVVETYRLPPTLIAESERLKRRTFPYAVLGMLAIIAIAALGALSDPSIPWRQTFETERSWFNTHFPTAVAVTVHYVSAMIGLCLLGISFWIQGSRIAENYGTIDRVLAEVERVRQMRGLPARDAADAGKAPT